MDGVGEWATTAIARGSGAGIEPIEEIRFPHSLGLLYSAFTAYCGFRVNSGEYKLMGLAPYGEPTWVRTIRDELVSLNEDGSFRLNLEYLDPLADDRLTNARFHARFGGPPRRPEEPLEPRHRDLARSIQVVPEEAMLRLARRAHERTGSGGLCLAGGVALNFVAHGRIPREGTLREAWTHTAPGDFAP